MALSERMLALQRAMNRYGEATVRNYQVIHPFGEALIARLRTYLGDEAKVLGVPPNGEFRTDVGEYAEAKFSTYHNPRLSLKPIQMGLSVGIPHTKDKGHYWPHVVIELEIEGDTISMTVGDSSTKLRGLPLSPGDADLDRACEDVFEYMKGVLENPVRAMTAVGTGKFGFTA